ncbi:hypothetical protein KCP70_04885 [Salmonella enterica subsp. enterica]|nr:hypothetical protein KCP70_04885 [Salmonella enterica subsp. enterica]
MAECVQMDRWYEPPVEFANGLARAARPRLAHQLRVCSVTDQHLHPSPLLGQAVFTRCAGPIGFGKRHTEKRRASSGGVLSAGTGEVHTKRAFGHNTTGLYGMTRHTGLRAKGAVTAGGRTLAGISQDCRFAAVHRHLSAGRRVFARYCVGGVGLCVRDGRRRRRTWNGIAGMKPDGRHRDLGGSGGGTGYRSNPSVRKIGGKG